MENHKLEILFEAFYQKRLSSLEFACDGSPLSCLNTNELTVLRILASKGPMVMGRLADSSGLAMSTLTGITDKLTTHGLLQRDRDPSDRRIVRVELSGRGLEAFEDRMETKNEVCRDILSPLTNEEKTHFLSLMEKIINS